MIVSYIDSMGASLYDPNATDLPIITITGGRLNYTRVWIADIADPKNAPRKWWVNGKFIAEDKRTILIDGHDENFFVTLEKTNQFGTKREEFHLLYPRDAIGGNEGGAWGNDARVVKPPDFLNPGTTIGGAGAYYSNSDIYLTDWHIWQDIVLEINDG